MESQFCYDVGTELEFLDGSFDGSNDDKLEGLLIVDSLVSTHGKVLGYNEGIKLGISDGKSFVTIPINVDGITLGIDVGPKLGSLDGSFDGSKYGKLERLLHGDSQISAHGKVLASDEGIKLGLSDGKLSVTILGNEDGITLGIDVGT